MNTSKTLIALLILAILVVAGYFVYQNYLAPIPQPTQLAETPPAAQVEERISAEGTLIPARQVSLAFVQAGRVAEVLVEEGQVVKAGEPLARLDTRLLQAAQVQAGAVLETAKSNLQAARTRLAAARLAARAAEAPARSTAWEGEAPDEFEQPGWYFEKDRQTASSQVEVDAASAALEIEKANLANVLRQASSAGLVEAEARLSDARMAFLVAQEVFDRAKDSNDPDLRDQAETNFDSARSELDAAQRAYDQILDTQAAIDVLEARARLAVAQERYDTAQERLDRLQTGDRSPEVLQAIDAAALAKAAVAEAEAALESARLAVEEATLAAPVDGVVAQLDLEAGEVTVPGRQALLLASLASWKVETTDLSETDIVLLVPGLSATISLDAFPDLTFRGEIEKIALVSQDSRGSVTYTVTVKFDPGQAPVRWGMTAFVVFERP